MAIDTALATGYQQGFRYIFILNAALAAFACIISLWLIPHQSVDRQDDEKQRQEAAERLREEERATLERAP